jgi:hypothetical protein
MFGLFCNLAISFTFVFGITMVVRTAPIFMFVNYFLGGIAIYVILAGVLGTLLRRSDIHWRTRSPERKSQYSIRAILAAMVGAAVLMLALKWFPTDIMNNRPNGKIMMLVTPAIWIVWLAVAIAVLIWLQLASVFHTQRRRFWTLLLITMALGPLLFLWVGRWIWIWLPNAPSKLFSIQTLWAYAIELGLVLGVAIVIRLLPPPKGFEPLAGGKRSATSGPEPT